MLSNNLLLAGDDGYNLTKSLRFRSSASAYLNRTFGTPTNAKKWTYSLWVKGSPWANAKLLAICTSGSSEAQINFTGGQLQINSYNGVSTDYVIRTDAVYRDPSSWYHLVFVYDTDNATSTDRAIIYVNGVRQSVTAPNNGMFPSGYSHLFNTNGAVTYIGARPTFLDGFFDGCLTELNFIDGQALTPNSFGTFNSYGVWQPITYGGSYGNNGFYLPFTNKTSTTTLGYDFSPQGNNWTTNNISLTAGSTYDSMTDVPTLTSATAANYCVLNPLSALNSTASNGNLKGTLNAASVTTDIYGTMASGTTGKFYWETTYVSRSGNSALTTGGVRSDVFGAEPSGTGGFGYYSVGGQVFVNGSTVVTYATYATSDVIGIALDLTNSQVSFYKQTSGTGSFVLQGTVSISSGYSWIPGYSNGTTSGNQVVTVNFGQQPFNNSSPPSGFLALNTYNI